MTEQESLDLKECKECYFEWYEKKSRYTAQNIWS